MNQFEITALTGLVTMFLSLSIPIIAVIMSVWNNVKNKEQDTELRKLIVEKQVDTESVRLLIAQMEKKSNPYKPLRWGCVLVGAGLGALVNYLIHTEVASPFFWLVLAVGVGIGLLISFIVEQKLSKKAAEEQS